MPDVRGSRSPSIRCDSSRREIEQHDEGRTIRLGRWHITIRRDTRQRPPTEWAPGGYIAPPGGASLADTVPFTTRTLRTADQQFAQAIGVLLAPESDAGRIAWTVSCPHIPNEVLTGTFTWTMADGAPAPMIVRDGKVINELFA